jgi:hypothetical protein
MPETMTNVEIATRNDAIRRLLPLTHQDDRFVMTCGIDALGVEVITDAIQVVRDFNEFTEDNDPYGEHDFGSFILTNGDKAFWKIDDYQGHDGIRCVMTILLADEY